MGWFPEMETEKWRRYAQRRIEEEAQNHAEYLQQKTVSDFEHYVDMRERGEMKKAAVPQC